jgi:SsrA-binding protein
LNKKEILKIEMKIKKDGYTLVPLELFFSQGLVKVEIALAKGKKLYDKRESIAKKSQERDIQRQMKR